MGVADPYTARSEVRASHLPFEGFLEGICRLATLKALPDEEALAAGEWAHAGAYLCDLRENRPEEYGKFVRANANEWGAPPRQPLSRCVHHLMAYILFMIERSTRGADDLQLDEKEVALFFASSAK